MCRGKLNVNNKDKETACLFWVNYHFNLILWQLQRLPLNWWKANHIVCSDLTFSSKAFECDSALMNLCSCVIPSWRCTGGSGDWQLCRARTRANREVKPKSLSSKCAGATGRSHVDFEQVWNFFTFICHFPTFKWKVVLITIFRSIQTPCISI